MNTKIKKYYGSILVILGLIFATSAFVFKDKFQLSLFFPYTNAGDNVDINGEFIVNINSGEHVFAPSLIKWQWSKTGSKGVRYSDGSVPLTSEIKKCLKSKITDTVSKTCSQDYVVKAPDLAGVYDFTDYISDTAGRRVISILNQKPTFQLQVTKVIGCRADSESSNSLNIANGQGTKISYYTYEGASCTKTPKSEKYIISCNQGYEQQGKDESATCIKTQIGTCLFNGKNYAVNEESTHDTGIFVCIKPEGADAFWTAKENIACQNDKPGICVNNALVYQVCKNTKYADTILSCSNTQECSEEDQKCNDKIVPCPQKNINSNDCRGEIITEIDNNGCYVDTCQEKIEEEEKLSITQITLLIIGVLSVLGGIYLFRR